MIPWLLPDDEGMPTPAAMAPSEFIDKCKSFAQHLNSSPDFACAKPTPCPFIVTVVDALPSATPIDGSRGADARTTLACTVHIGQAHYTEPLRDDWRGCAARLWQIRRLLCKQPLKRKLRNSKNLVARCGSASSRYVSIKKLSARTYLLQTSTRLSSGRVARGKCEFDGMTPKARRSQCHNPYMKHQLMLHKMCMESQKHISTSWNRTRSR
jgi:hypothetical protein